MSSVSSVNSYNSTTQLLQSINSTSSSKSSAYNYSTSSSSSGSLLNNLYSNKSTNLSESAKSYLSTIKSGAEDLKSAMANISGKKTAFNTKAANSSNRDVLTVSGTGNGKTASVKVSQLAQKQVNTGTAMSNKSKSINTGNYTFSMDFGDGKTQSFNIRAAATDTNEDVQKKVADAINSVAKGGVSASVKKNENGSTSLVLSSKETGTDNSFSFKGELANALGMNNVTQEAKNARYLEDGEERFSSSNTVELSNGVKATFKSTSESAVTVGYGNDTEGMISAIKDMVGAYNSMLESSGSSSNAGAAKLKNQLKTLADTYGNALKGIGITAGKDGKLAIDEKKLSTSAEDGSLSRFVKSSSDGTSSYGFGNRLDRLASNVAKDPLQYYKTEGKSSSSSSNSNSSGSSDEGYSFSFNDFSANQLRMLVNYDAVGLMFDYSL